MPDPMGISNRALALVGANMIIAHDEDSTPAKLCANEYQACVDDLLHQHDWNFASRRATTLATLVVAPGWGYAYAFQLPAGPGEPQPYCLRVRETSEDAAGLRGRWQVEGRTLVADVPTLSIRYTARVEALIFPPAFATTIAFELAARLAYPLTGKPSLAEGLGASAARRLAVAKALDGQEGASRRTTTTALTEVRP